MNLDDEVTKIFGVGDVQARRLKKLGIETISDLLFYYPISYQDRRKITPIANLKIGNFYVVRARINSIRNIRVWRHRMGITEAEIEDKTGKTKVIWFNQPFLVRNLKAGDNVLLFGKFIKKGICYLTSPEYEKIKGQVLHAGRIIPVYRLTKGITAKMMRYFVDQALKKCCYQVKEYLPREVLKQEKLMELQEMLKNIHFPVNEKLERAARERASFDELFLIQLSVISNRKRWQEREAFPIKYQKETAAKFYKSLPYKFTKDQQKATLEIINDLQKGHPMNRLLNGDVGSGKTAVAMFALVQIFKNGFQSAFMVPTEVLASQHFKTLSENLKIFPLSIAILTRSERKIASFKISRENSRVKIEKLSKKKILEKIESREIDIVIGTHALIQEGVKFKNLAFVIVDEQHRFGVKQRAMLQKKNIKVPHLLSMTATPIPRTLALTVYGDLDISILKEMPPGRKKIKTKLITAREHYKAFQAIKKEVKKGRQVFVICPLIEEPITLPEKRRLEARSVKLEYKKLKKDVFPKFKIGMLHGKMKAAEKEKIMEDFKNKKIDILVSTSVVEVGVDIPNASLMMIENAERFGLAQIHQFRGRVGRSKYQSYCFLFTESESEETLERLRAVAQSADGFALAEKDLEIRGPGEIYGVRQSGLPDLKIASLTDLIMIKRTKKRAKEILEKDPGLEKHPNLAEKLKGFETSIHLE